MFYLSCLILTAEMHQKTVDLYLLGSRGAAVPDCKSLPQAPCVQVTERDEAMPHPTGCQLWPQVLTGGDIPSCPPRTAQGLQGSMPVSPEHPATAARRLSTSVYCKGMIGLFCAFEGFFSSSLSPLCPRVTPDPPHLPSDSGQVGWNMLLPASCAQMCHADGSAGRERGLPTNHCLQFLLNPFSFPNYYNSS